MGKRSISEEEKRAAILAVSEHLSLHGPRNWEPLITKLGISRPTLFKYVKEIQSITDSDKSPGLLYSAQRSIKKVVKELAAETGKCLPAIPSPNIIAAKGESALVNIRYMARVDKLLGDAEMIRTYSIKIDDAGVESIKNPMMFLNSVKLQNDLLKTALQAMQEVYDINKIQDMHRVILEVVGRAAPEVQLEIINALRDLNNRYGLTVEARI